MLNIEEEDEGGLESLIWVSILVNRRTCYASFLSRLNKLNDNKRSRGKGNEEPENRIKFNILGQISDPNNSTWQTK